MVWLQKALILKHWVWLCQKIRPHNFLSKPDIFLMHITPFCPSSFSLANKMLTSHVWLSCEGKKIKYIPNINKKRKDILREKEKKCTEHVFTCSAGKSCQAQWKTSSEASCHGEGAGPSASTQRLFWECSAHPCQCWAELREAGRKGGVLLPPTDPTAILSFSQVEGKNSCLGLKNKALLPQQHCVCFVLVYSFSLILFGFFLLWL